MHGAKPVSIMMNSASGLLPIQHGGGPPSPGQPSLAQSYASPKSLVRHVFVIRPYQQGAAGTAVTLTNDAPCFTRRSIAETSRRQAGMRYRLFEQGYGTNRASSTA